MRARLEGLRIPRNQRPGGATAPRPRRGRWALGLLLIAAAAAGAYYARDAIGTRLDLLTGRAARAADVRLVAVARRPDPEPDPVLIATGKVVSDHLVQVRTKVSGQIVSLYFEQGDMVRKGQVLARIEDVIYRARRDEAAARLERSRANLAFQRVNFRRVEELFRRGSAPEIEFADARRAVEEAEAQVAADAAVLEYAQKMLTDCEVLAPITGVILQRNVEVGDFVAAEGGLGANANAQFGTIADMSVLRVEVDISELDIGRIRQGMPCVVVPDAYKDCRYRGHVMWIDPGANYAKATVGVKVRIENPDARLRVEGSAQVSFFDEPPHATATQAASAIWVPATAIARGSDGRASVYVARDGRLRATPVRIGRERSTLVEVTHGLEEGQRIAAEGLDRLRDGQRLHS